MKQLFKLSILVMTAVIITLTSAACGGGGTQTVTFDLVPEHYTHDPYVSSQSAATGDIIQLTMPQNNKYFIDVADQKDEDGNPVFISGFQIFDAGNGKGESKELLFGGGFDNYSSAENTVRLLRDAYERHDHEDYEGENVTVFRECENDQITYVLSLIDNGGSYVIYGIAFLKDSNTSLMLIADRVNDGPGLLDTLDYLFNNMQFKVIAQ